MAESDGGELAEALWDVFHSDRLEVERSLGTDAVRAALARGEIRSDDLVRPAGTTIPWAPLADFPALLEAPTPPSPSTEEEAGPLSFAQVDPGIEVDDPLSFSILDDDDDDDDLAGVVVGQDEGEVAIPDDEELSRFDLDPELDSPSRMALPVVESRDWDEDEEGYDPQDEDEEAAEFTLSRGSAERVEELDLAAMVDVAFQLVLFFLVTATTILYKSLEVPKPNPESPANAAAQGRSRSLDDLKNDYILVEVDAAGAMKIDREPVVADMAALAERLRTAREKTGRKAMLISADFATPHRSAVLAYDAANEIGLGIAIARPSAPGPAAPAPIPKKAANP